ncbi:MAG: CpXC domain-containing protein [Verrucomicrobiota bacterium]
MSNSNNDNSQAKNDNPGERHQCPECGHSQTVTPVSLVTPESDELTDLFQANLNTCVCESCGQKFFLSVPVLFRDEEGNVLVYYIPEEIRDDRRKTEENMQGIINDLFVGRSASQMPRCRLVLTYRGFMEKISIFLDGLDDVVIEYIKYHLYKDEKRQLDPVRMEMLYDYSNEEDENNIDFLVFDRETGDAMSGINIPVDVHQEVKACIEKDADVKKEVEKLFAGYYVNVDRIFEEGLDTE